MTKSDPTKNQECGANVIENIFRSCLPILEIAEPILRLASGKNKNVAPISAVVSGVVSSLKKYFASGKKVNKDALNNIAEMLKGVKTNMSKKEADEFIKRLREEADNLEASK